MRRKIGAALCFGCACVQPLANPRNAAYRMVDNAGELASRLASLNPANVSVTRAIFEGETHVSGQLAALNRAIRFAPPPK